MAEGGGSLAGVQGSQLNFFLSGHSHPTRNLFWNLPCMDVKLFCSFQDLPFTPSGKNPPHGHKVLPACPLPLTSSEPLTHLQPMGLLFT